jgi:hypothetical protein
VVRTFCHCVVLPLNIALVVLVVSTADSMPRTGPMAIMPQQLGAARQCSHFWTMVLVVSGALRPSKVTAAAHCYCDGSATNTVHRV